jgi:hypothetical protein
MKEQRSPAPERDGGSATAVTSRDAAGLRVERSCLVIADVTGYTAYLANSEIEHAPLIAGDLLERVVGAFGPRFRLLKLEGDAAFLEAPLDGVDGSILLDAVEGAHDAFRRRLLSFAAASACDCQSCGRAPALDLKVIAHAGDVVRQRIVGREEVSGRDVILAHRLLKGTAAARLGLRSFAALTEATVRALGLDASAIGLVPATERIEHLGDVRVHLLDLATRWEAARAAEPAAIDGEPLLRLATVLPVASPVAWAHLTLPELRSRWQGVRIVEEPAEAGRRGLGSLSRCLSGQLATLEEVVEWRPHRGVAWRTTLAGGVLVTTSWALEEVDGGTRLEVTCRSEPAAPEPDVRGMVERQQAALERLERLLAAPGDGGAEGLLA